MRAAIDNISMDCNEKPFVLIKPNGYTLLEQKEGQIRVATARELAIPQRTKVGYAIVNCSVWGNNAGQSNSFWVGALQFSCMTRLVTGAVSVANNTQFIDAGAGNYRLAQWSPCRHAHERSHYDIAGRFGWQFADFLGDGVGVVDMGC